MDRPTTGPAESGSAESEQMPTTANSNESQPSQQVNGAMITAIEGIVTKLQQVAVGPTNPSYSISKLTGIGENVDEWLEHFERHARLQQLAVTQYCDAFAFHVTGVAETWFFTLPPTTKTDWVKLREACQQRFAVSQHGRWRQERDLYLLRQQPGQSVANYTANILKASRGLEMSQSQLLRLVLGGLHPTVVPFVEQSQPESIDQLLQCPAARNGMTAPLDQSVIPEQSDQFVNVSALSNNRITRENRPVQGDWRQSQASRSDRCDAWHGAGDDRDGCHSDGQWRSSRDDTRKRENARYTHQTGGARAQTGAHYDNWESNAHESYERDTADNTRRGGTRGYYDTRRRNRDNNRTRDPCDKCGRLCEGGRFCFALNKRCHGCHQLNHFVAQCPRQ